MSWQAVRVAPAVAIAHTGAASMRARERAYLVCPSCAAELELELAGAGSGERSGDSR